MTLKFDNTNFFISSTEPKKLPQSICEVAIVGRSIIGKSSIINASCKQKNLYKNFKNAGKNKSNKYFYTG